MDGHSNDMSGRRRWARGFVCRVVGGKRIGENGIPCDTPVGIQIARVQHWLVKHKEAIRGVVESATCCSTVAGVMWLALFVRAGKRFTREATTNSANSLEIEILSNTRNMHQFLHIDEQTNSALKFDPQSFSV